MSTEPMDVDVDVENVSAKSNNADEEAGVSDTEMTDPKENSPVKEPAVANEDDEHEEGDEASQEVVEDADERANGEDVDGHEPETKNDEHEESQSPSKSGTKNEKSVLDIPEESVREIICKCFDDPPEEGLTRRIIYTKLSEEFGFEPSDWKDHRKDEIKRYIEEAMKQSDEDGEEDGEEEPAEDDPPPKKTRRSSRKEKKSRKRRREEDEDEDDEAPPKKRRRGRPSKQKNGASVSPKKKKSRRKSKKKRKNDSESDVKDSESDFEMEEPETKRTRKTGRKSKGKKRRTKLEKLRSLLKIANLGKPALYKRLKELDEKKQVREIEKLLDEHDVRHRPGDLTEDAIARFKRDTEMEREVEELNLAGDLDVTSGRPSRRKTKVDYSKILEGPAIEFHTDEEEVEQEVEPQSDDGDESEYEPDSED